MRMETFAVIHHDVRQLGPGELPAVRELFEECAAFFQSIHMEPEQEADQLFEDVPPGKSLEDKLVLGFSVQGSPERLVGLLELLRGYPGPDDWYVGLLLIAPGHRGHGLGTAIFQGMTRSVLAAGGRALHLIVQEQNTGACRFWLRQGFQLGDKVIQQTQSGTNSVQRMTLGLQASPAGPAPSR